MPLGVLISKRPVATAGRRNCHPCLTELPPQKAPDLRGRNAQRVLARALRRRGRVVNDVVLAGADAEMKDHARLHRRCIMTKKDFSEQRGELNPCAERGVSMAGLGATACSRKSVPRSSEHTSFQL